MTTIKATEARAELYKLLDQTADSHEPIQITGKRSNAILISEEDWRSIQETLYLTSIPNMRESILEGLGNSLSSQLLFTTHNCFFSMIITEAQGLRELGTQIFVALGAHKTKATGIECCTGTDTCILEGLEYLKQLNRNMIAPEYFKGKTIYKTSYLLVKIISLLITLALTCFNVAPLCGSQAGAGHGKLDCYW
jgi:prevent-host-death family protein